MWKAIGANKNSEPSGVWRISKWGNYSRSVRFNQNSTGKRETKFTETYSRSWKSNRWWERNIVEEKHTVDQMIEFMGFEKLTPEVLQKYVKAIYMHDDGRIEMCWKELK